MERVEIKSGDYSVRVLSKGATLESFKYRDSDIIVGYDNIEDYKTTTEYYSEVIGPFANRIKDARFTLDGKEYNLEKNDNNNNLHSGSKNFGYHEWSIDQAEKDYVKLSLESPESGGFPGKHKVSVKYSLNDRGSLRIDYRVESDEKCPVNITNHAFFNLSNGKDIRETLLYIDSDYYVDVDPLLIPTSIKSVDDTDFDFREPMHIGDRRSGAYDHCYILKSKRAIIAASKEFRLSVETDLPAVQLYTGSKIKPTHRAKGGGELKPYSGFCLETEFYPDFPNRNDFRGAYTSKDRPFETYTIFTLEKL